MMKLLSADPVCLSLSKQTNASLTTSFQDNLGKPAPEGKTISDEARDDGVAEASARPYANHLHLTVDR